MGFKLPSAGLTPAPSDFVSFGRSEESRFLCCPGWPLRPPIPRPLFYGRGGRRAQPPVGEGSAITSQNLARPFFVSSRAVFYVTQSPYPARFFCARLSSSSRRVIGNIVITRSEPGTRPKTPFRISSVQQRRFLRIERPSVVCRVRPPTTVHECCDQLAHFLKFVLQRVEQCARNRMMRLAPPDQPVFDLQALWSDHRGLAVLVKRLQR
jgi:hypothetical protein